MWLKMLSRLMPMDKSKSNRKGSNAPKVEGIVRLPNILRSLNITNDKGIADTIDNFDKAIAPFRIGLENDKGFVKTSRTIHRLGQPFVMM